MQFMNAAHKLFAGFNCKRYAQVIWIVQYHERYIHKLHSCEKLFGNSGEQNSLKCACQNWSVATESEWRCITFIPEIEHGHHQTVVDSHHDRRHPHTNWVPFGAKKTREISMKIRQGRFSLHLFGAKRPILFGIQKSVIVISQNTLTNTNSGLINCIEIYAFCSLHRFFEHQTPL